MAHFYAKIFQKSEITWNTATNTLSQICEIYAFTIFLQMLLLSYTDSCYWLSCNE